MREALAVELYRRYLGGETIEQLSAELGISAERIRQRLDAAAAHLVRKGQRAA
ncbi:MAG TPA: sigma factor-like helix-turn-helix DNA-binding protein [Bryobacteraceae bacterium]|nr:sigma factor-like helix-turn-helix DNA-binding protein [Bryobacteraceae bacterium]